jgi:His-Xaa-Ser system protein HxsD
MEKSNLNIDKKEKLVKISVNPKIYSLEVIYSSAYVFLDKAYILIEGDPKKEIIVELKPKKEYNLEKLGREFNNELLNYATYATISKKNDGIRKILLQKALFTNSVVSNKEEVDFKEVLKELEEGDHLEDPEDIAIPWEDKYGSKKKEGKKGKLGEKFKIVYKGKGHVIREGEELIDVCEKLGVQFGCKNGTCGTCKIEIINGSENISELTEVEKELGGDNKTRFACQCKMGNGDIEIKNPGSW